MEKTNKDHAILLINCPDKQGIVAEVSDFLYKNNGNVIQLEQHTDKESGLFFMRVEWELESFGIPRQKIADYFKTLIADRLGMNFRLYFAQDTPRMAIFVSKMAHCLYDLLARASEWNVEIPLIISNHPDLEHIAHKFGIPYYHLPITKENKAEQEAKQLELLKKHDVNFIVLARYMQILSGDLIAHYPKHVINIHHSFLPAFPGAKPYHSAYERGVKIIGATSHYVTEELDAGPIIEQGVVHVSHKESIKDFIRKGKDLEKMVLSHAVWNHLQRQVLVYNNRTVVFNQ